MQMGAAAAHNARRQFSRYRPPVRHRPPLAPVERHLGFERDILNDDVFVALMTRTRRRRRRQRHRAVDAQLRHAGTATARRRRIRLARLLRRKTIGRLFHARRLHWRSRRQTLQTPDLVLKLLVLEPRRRQRRVQLLVFFPKPLNLADQSANQPDQLGRAKPLKRIIRARRHPQLESYLQTLDSPLRPGICPGYRFRGSYPRPLVPTRPEGPRKTLQRAPSPRHF